jgi:hypothetical protein
MSMILASVLIIISISFIKTLNTMKKIIIGLAALLMAATINITNAQSAKDSRMPMKQERLERKQQKALEQQERKEALLDLVHDQSFVLEADALYDRYRNRYNATANNFIMFDGERMILQTAFPTRIGYNGLGGITVDGKITDYKVTESKSTISITAQVISSVLGHGTLTMNIGNSGYADATFSDTWGNRISFSGHLESLEDSKLFEGMSI